MKRTGILMAVWIFAILALVVGPTWAGRNQDNRNARDRGQTAQPAKPAPQTRSKASERSARPTQPNRQAQPSRPAQPQKPASQPIRSWGPDNNHRGTLSLGKAPANKPVYTPPVRAPKPDTRQPVAAPQPDKRQPVAAPQPDTRQPVAAPQPDTRQPVAAPQPGKRSFTPPALPRLGQGRGGEQVRRSPTQGRQEKVVPTIPNKPTFTPSAPKPPAFAPTTRADDNRGKPVGKAPSATQPRVGGDAPRSGSWQDHVRPGQPASSKPPVIRRPAPGPAPAPAPKVGERTTRQANDRPMVRNLKGQKGFNPELDPEWRRPRVKIDGRALQLKDKPRFEQGHMVVPAPEFFRGLGAKVWQDQGNHWWYAQRNGHELRFKIGDRHAWYDNHQILLVVAPIIINNLVYCPIDDFAPYLPAAFNVQYQVDYEPAVSEGLAVWKAMTYLQSVGAYASDIQYAEAHQNTAPANRFWDLVTIGHDPIADAPMRWCWVVEFDYPGGWEQVFVDAETGDVIGGSAS